MSGNETDGAQVEVRPNQLRGNFTPTEDNLPLYESQEDKTVFFFFISPGPSC